METFIITVFIAGLGCGFLITQIIQLIRDCKELQRSLKK